MKAKAFIVILCAASLLLAGCTNGLLLNNGIFTHTIEPLTFNQEAIKVRESQREGLGRIQQFTTSPFSPLVSIRLGKNGLGDVAKEHGIETIYYADLERWSAVFGLWSMDVVHIYGR